MVLMGHLIERQGVLLVIKVCLGPLALATYLVRPTFAVVGDA